MSRAARILRFAAGKLIAAAITVWATTLIVFLSLYLVPGDPLSVLLRGRKPTPEVVAALRQEYGLDQPLLVRYWDWFTGLLRGDLGFSIQHQTDVATVVASRLPTTLWLVAYAAIIIVVVGVLLGIWSAVTTRRSVTHGILLGTSVLSAIPAFVAALVLMLVFSGALGWFPAFGSGDATFASRIQHLTLPAFALALTYIGLIARVTANSLKHEIGSDHVQAARIRGLSGGYLFRHHVLRNGLNPILSYGGVLVAGLLVTSQLVEYAFGLNGIGRLLVESVRNIDFAVVQIVTILIVVSFIVTNTIVDLIAPLINPQLRDRVSS